MKKIFFILLLVFGMSLYSQTYDYPPQMTYAEFQKYIPVGSEIIAYSNNHFIVKEGILKFIYIAQMCYAGSLGQYHYWTFTVILIPG